MAQSNLDRNFDMIIYILNILNQKYGLDIKVEKVNDSKILPRIDKQIMTIKFNIRLRSLFVLHKIGNADLIIKYFLAHKYMSYGMYDKAEFWIEKFEIKAKKVVLKNNGLIQNIINGSYSLKKLSEDNRMKEDELLMYQLLFVFLHEYSHGLFCQKQEYKDDYFNRIKDSLEGFKDYRNNEDDMLNLISHELPWGMRSFLMEHIGYGYINRKLDLIKNVQSDNRKIEEFACDLHAWNILATILHYGGYSLDEQIVVFVDAIESLYYLECYKTLDDCLSYKVDMDKAENIALFDSMRYSLLTHTIVLYLEGKQKGRGLTFDRHFSIFRWKERKEFISLINKYVAVTRDLENGALIINKEQAAPLYDRIDAMESSLL